jgi:Raf kinase inhibitor-like YbhB/YbcL family protein
MKTQEKVMAFRLTSKAFKDGEMIPARYTADGENVSPPMDWSEAPPGTKSFTLICDDPDAPGGSFVHWILYNIPANTLSLPEATPALKAFPNGSRHGLGDYGVPGYRGPAPPSGVHRYFFTLYALRIVLDPAESVKKAQIENMMKGRILEHAQLMGKYQRSR